MECMKCGRPTEENQVFCPDCLAVMAQSPVKSGTPVLIPQRPERVRVPPTKEEKPEEIIQKLELRIRKLRRAVALLLVLVLGCVGFLVYHFYETNHDLPAIGQNYSTEQSGVSNPRTR